eukprot:5409129-Prymnesium_polylepis.1
MHRHTARPTHATLTSHTALSRPRTPGCALLWFCLLTSLTPCASRSRRLERTHTEPKQAAVEAQGSHGPEHTVLSQRAAKGKGARAVLLPQQFASSPASRSLACRPLLA